MITAYISQHTHHALEVLKHLHLKAREGETPMTAIDLSREIGVGLNNTYETLRKLRQAKLVYGQRGVQGGYVYVFNGEYLVSDIVKRVERVRERRGDYLHKLLLHALSKYTLADYINISLGLETCKKEGEKKCKN